MGRASARSSRAGTGRRAISYRRIEGIPDEWGTAVNVQTMVFGNMGDNSATGVAFTRNPATGENKFYGEWLVNAQGEDVVAGIRTPNPLNEATKNEQNKHLPSLETAMPGLYKELDDIRTKLEKHYHDMQDIEFTIQDGKLYMLQCRNGKRTGTARLEHGHGHARRGADRREDGRHPRAAGAAGRAAAPDHRPGSREEGRGASSPACRPGRAGPAARSSSPRSTPWPGPRQGKKVILVREETNPEDVEGHARGAGHPHRPRRHDQPRGPGGPRLGQVLHRRRRRR